MTLRHVVPLVLSLLLAAAAPSAAVQCVPENAPVTVTGVLHWTQKDGYTLAKPDKLFCTETTAEYWDLDEIDLTVFGLESKAARCKGRKTTVSGHYYMAPEFMWIVPFVAADSLSC